MCNLLLNRIQKTTEDPGLDLNPAGCFELSGSHFASGPNS